jgi:hypothetical protein
MPINAPNSQRKKKQKRKDRAAFLLSPNLRFLSGIVLLPALFLSSGPWGALAQLFFSALLFIWAGKRIRLASNAVFFLSVVAFALLAPQGRVLADWGWLKPSVGALAVGVCRASTLLSLIFVSGFAVSPAMRLPGALGSALSRVFFYSSRLVEAQAELNLRRPFESMDGLLFSVYDPRGREAPSQDEPSVSTPPSAPSLPSAPSPQPGTVPPQRIAIGLAIIFLFCLALYGAAFFPPLRARLY